MSQYDPIHKIEEAKVVEVAAFGSWVYKYHIREILNIQRSDQYREEIQILENDLPGFRKLYAEQSQKHRVRVEVARIIISTIMKRGTGRNTEVRFVYTE